MLSEVASRYTIVTWIFPSMYPVYLSMRVAITVSERSSESLLMMVRMSILDYWSR